MYRSALAHRDLRLLLSAMLVSMAGSWAYNVALLVSLSVLATVVYGMDTVLFVGASEERLGLGPDGFGVLLTGLAVGGLLAAPAVNRLAGIAAYPALVRMDRAAAARTALLASRAAVLESTALFAAAPRPVLERLAAETREIAATAGETLIHQGDRADALYVLRTGVVAVRAGDRELATLGPGSWFGEIGLLEQVPRTATVDATEACTLLRIDGETFLEALTTAPLSSTALEGARARYAAVRPHLPQRIQEVVA